MLDLEKIFRRVVYRPHRDTKGRILISSGKKELILAVSPYCSLDLSGDIKIGNHVMIGKGAHLLTHEHIIKGRDPILLRVGSDLEKIVLYSKEICDDVWINKSIILGKCQKIARGVVIGAGSVVTKSINEEYSIWAGNPARKVGER